MTSTTQNLLNTPLLIIKGSGYDKSIEAFNADTNADRIYPNVIKIVKIYDQNNNELTSPQLRQDDKIINDGDNYYIVRTEDSKKIEVWNPKTNNLKILEMPIEFDWGSFNVLNGSIYFSEFNYYNPNIEASKPKCGEYADKLGKCKIYEVNPSTLKSDVLLEGISSGPYGGIAEKIISKDSSFIWLKSGFGDGGSSTASYLKYDTKTKKLIETITINNSFSDQELIYTAAGKKSQKITSIKCVDEQSGDPSVSICTPKQYSDFGAQVYKLVPKEFYKSQDPALEVNEKKICGKHEIVLLPQNPTQPNTNQGQQVLYEGQPVLNYKQISIETSICVE